MIFQENVDMTNPAFIKYQKIVDDNFNIDNVLQQFYNALENYYTEDNEEAKIRKFSKYISREYRAVSQIKNQDHRECWRELYTDIIGEDTILDLSEYKLPQVRQLNGIVTDIDIDTATANKFFEEGFKCIQKFTFNLI
jgi:hypothetical protein